MEPFDIMTRSRMDLPPELTLCINGRNCLFNRVLGEGKGKKGIVMEGEDHEYIARILDATGFKKAELANSIQKLSTVYQHDSVLVILDIRFEDDKCIILSQRAKGFDLNYCLKKERYGSSETRFEMISQLAEGIYHLHTNNHPHGNLAPSDIFIVKVENRVHVQIADAGLVAALSSTAFSKKMTEFINNNAYVYLAPEVFQASENPGAHGERWRRKESDVFALGKIMKDIALQGTFGDDIDKLARAMTSQLPSRRPTMEQVVKEIKAIKQKLDLLHGEIEASHEVADKTQASENSNNPQSKDTQPTQSSEEVHFAAPTGQDMKKGGKDSVQPGKPQEVKVKPAGNLSPQENEDGKVGPKNDQGKPEAPAPPKKEEQDMAALKKEERDLPVKKDEAKKPNASTPTSQPQDTRPKLNPDGKPTSPSVKAMPRSADTKAPQANQSSQPPGAKVLGSKAIGSSPPPKVPSKIIAAPKPKKEIDEYEGKTQGVEDKGSVSSTNSAERAPEKPRRSSCCPNFKLHAIWFLVVILACSLTFLATHSCSVDVCSNPKACADMPFTISCSPSDDTWFTGIVQRFSELTTMVKDYRSPKTDHGSQGPGSKSTDTTKPGAEQQRQEGRNSESGEDGGGGGSFGWIVLTVIVIGVVAIVIVFFRSKKPTSKKEQTVSAPANNRLRQTMTAKKKRN